MFPGCSCPGPTKECPHYGLMDGRRWEICQGIRVSEQERHRLMEAFTGKPTEPPLLTKLGNYVKSTVRHVANGLKNATEEEVKARLAVCQSCDLLLENGVCAGCGCPTKEKATRKHEHCPLRRWPGDVMEDVKPCNCSVKPESA